MNLHLVGPIGGVTRRLQRQYELVSFVSGGTYGEVWKAVRKVPDASLARRGSTGELEHPFYAVKKIKALPASHDAQEEISAGKSAMNSAINKPAKSTSASSQLLGVSMATLREIKLLKEIGRHPSIIALVDVVIDMESEGVVLVYEYVEMTLAALIARYKTKRVDHSDARRSGRGGSILPRRVMQSVMRQLIEGLRFLHANWVVHRDIKPKNILLARRGDAVGALKIADFGMARIFKSPAKAMAKSESEVVTLFYRAPELLLGAHSYGPAVDVWAAGCVFAECILGHPLFAAKPSLYGSDGHSTSTLGVASSTLRAASSASVKAGESSKRHPRGIPEKPFHANQCDTVFRMLKAPTPVNWPGVERTRHWNKIQRWSTTKPFQRNRLAKVIDCPATSSVLDLLSRMLVLDPTQRVTAIAALGHRFVKRTESVRPKRSKSVDANLMEFKRQKTNPK